MTPRARWALVTAGVALLLAAPFVVSARPVPSSRLSAGEVVERVRAARTLGWSGLVRTSGDVDLPAGDRLTGVADLLGGDSTLRVWWRDPRTWRVATLRPTGETDLVHRGDRLLRWVYESQRVTRVPDLPVRLPRAADLLPPVLAERVLQGARPEELSRIPTRRVAGRVAVGVRLEPADPSSAIGHVDVWADRTSGLPLRVEVYADHGPPALTTSVTDLDLGRPAEAVVGFRPPAGARLREDWVDDAVDVASAADRYSDRVAPDRLAGLPMVRRGLGPVGVYGRGPTLLLAVPLRSDDAEQLRRAMRRRPGGSCLAEGDAATTGPVSLFLTRRRLADDWLLAGTLTVEAMARTARQLPAGVGDQIGGLPTVTEPCP